MTTPCLIQASECSWYSLGCGPKLELGGNPNHHRALRRHYTKAGMSKLRFSVCYCSGEEPDYPADELNAHR